MCKAEHTCLHGVLLLFQKIHRMFILKDLQDAIHCFGSPQLQFLNLLVTQKASLGAVRGVTTRFLLN